MASAVRMVTSASSLPALGALNAPACALGSAAMSRSRSRSGSRFSVRSMPTAAGSRVTKVTAAQTAATDYMKNNMNTTMQGYTTATVTCTTQAPVVGIVWKTVVNVDFPPPSGVMHFGLPNSSTAGHILFPTKALYRK